MLHYIKFLFGPKLTFQTFMIRLMRPAHALPCDLKGFCPYDYALNPDRDIEGMPFVEDDWRSCPVFGHVCPVFMEDFGLSEVDLSIRATLHCGSVLRRMIEDGTIERTTGEHHLLLEHYAETASRYPAEKFPQFYN